MRGTLAAFAAFEVPVGIIPAHAGNTPAMRLSARSPWDHPRACGEHTQTVPPTTSGAGSSPRMRGTRIIYAKEIHQFGIIPAHAGNTLVSNGWEAQNRDHPRACGEHLDAEDMTLSMWGSSPRMRGTQRTHEGRGKGTGIIPAHAGNTLVFRPFPGVWGDHPRACGEHRCKITRGDVSPGSSPRMRGTRDVRPLADKGDGIIPAHAGNTKASEK